MNRISIGSNDIPALNKILYLAMLLEKPNAISDLGFGKEDNDSWNDDFSKSEKIREIKNCRFKLQRLLISFLDNERFEEYQLKILNCIEDELLNPICKPVQKGEILIQIKELNEKSVSLEFELDRAHNFIKYKFS